jgi:polyhydroxybutyrate depolymerase
MTFARIGTFVVASSFCLLSSCSLAGRNPGTSDQTIVVNGVVRHYSLHLPKSYQFRHGNLPLLVLLHGHGSSGVKIERSTGMSDKADKENFIAVYPDGRGQPSGWDLFDDAAGGNPDVAFISQLIDTLEKLYAVDKKRIYIAGHSNGGMMAYRLGIELDDRLAGIGVSEALLEKKFARDTLSPTPVTIVAIHGKADNVVPYDGSEGDMDYRPGFLSAPASVASYAKRNGCDGATEASKGDGNIVERTYQGCDAGSAAVLVTVKNLTHRWSGDRHGLGAIIDRGELIATNVMWDVLSRHSKQ